MFKSLFVNDEPEFQFNKFTCEVIAPKIEEPVIDPKAKPAKGAAPVSDLKFTEQEEATYGANKIYYEFKRTAQATDTAPEVEGIQPEIHIQLTMMYQGADYEDPNPPEEVIPDPKAKKAPAKGAQPVPDEPLPPRMITPPAVIIENEFGRLFRVELGRIEKDPVNDMVSEHAKSSSNLDTSQQQQQPSDEGTWVRYFASQQSEEPFAYFKSEGGVCHINGMKFRLNDDLGLKTIKSGTYELRITDVTKGLPPRLKTKSVKILIKFVDLDEEAAIIAA